MKNFLLISLAVFGLMACNSNDFAPAGTTGQGGSLARFAIVGDHLYTVDPQKMTVFDVSKVGTTTKISEQDFMWGQGVETIFPFDNNLFLGTEIGVLIYSLSDPTTPKQEGNFIHARACDPVVTDGQHAFVTLRAIEDRCWGGADNQLDILDVSDINNPTLLASYPMTSPKGLGLKEQTLFVCDDGLKVFDVSNVMDIKQTHHFNIPANDVIVHPDKLIVTADDGLYQYEFVGSELNLMGQIDFYIE